MSKLVAVEYSPNTPFTGKGKSSSPLDGCVGEASRKHLEAAIRRLRYEYNKNPESAPEITVAVRFPIVGPNSFLSFWMNDRDPSYEIQLLEEAEQVSLYDLSVLKRKPVSYYEGSTLQLSSDLTALFESETFLRTYGRDILYTKIDQVLGKFPNVWVWKSESSGYSGDMPPVFYGARIYGIDSVIHTYDPGVLSGIALEVFTRPWPAADKRKENYYHMRMNSDVYMFSSGTEYISHMDGVTIERTKSSWGTIKAHLNSLMLPCDAKKHRSNLGNYKGPSLKAPAASSGKNTKPKHNPTTITWTTTGNNVIGS